MSDFILSAFADEYSNEFELQLEGLNKLEIKYIELRGADNKNVSDFSHEDVKKYAMMLKNADIRVSSIGSPLGKISINGDFDSHLITAERIFETACTLNTKYCRIFSFYLPKNSVVQNYENEIFDKLSKLADLAEKYGITLCHENEAGIYGETPENCLKLLEADSRIKCAFDMGNFVLNGQQPYPYAYKMIKTHIAYFHIKDALSTGAIVPPGCGEASIKEIINDYRSQSDSDFFVSLEPHLQLFGGYNALTDRKYENPYKYETREVAFCDAAKRFSELW